MATIADNKHKCSNHRRAALEELQAGAAARADADERLARLQAEADERLATLEAHVKRLCDCLGEAAGFAEAVSPGTGHNAGLWATAITEARAMLSAQPSASNAEPVGDWRPHIARLARLHGNDWPAAALERLLQLTVTCGYSGAWSEDAQERAAQEERLALHRWAREVIEAGVAFQQTAYIEH